MALYYGLAPTYTGINIAVISAIVRVPDSEQDTLLFCLRHIYVSIMFNLPYINYQEMNRLHVSMLLFFVETLYKSDFP